MRNLIFLIIAFSFLFGSTSIIKEEELSFEFEIISDKNGLPDTVQAFIKSPVCEKDKCYEIQIIMRWDLIGRFREYDTLTGQGLTKLDHIPFIEEDYQKLDRLLKDPNSPIGDYKKEDLIHDTRKSDIDGFTGATIREINEIVVGGGVYSSYTLWQLANRKFTDSIKRMTTSLLDQKLINKLISKHDLAVNYFIINNLNSSDFLNYRNEIIEMITINKGYFVKSAIEKMPREIFQDSIIQDFFAKRFKTFNYFTQVAFLKQLNSISLIPSLKKELMSQKDNRNSLKNNLIEKKLF
jgi:hypothetical protein